MFARTTPTHRDPHPRRRPRRHRRRAWRPAAAAAGRRRRRSAGDRRRCSVAGAEQPVRLQSLQVDVEVAGGVAETRVQMVFFNPNTRVLEGKLQFPLGAGQVVSGFALDIDGQLRDAVPVEKARASRCSRTSRGAASTRACCRRRSATTTSCASIRSLPGKTRTRRADAGRVGAGPAAAAARLRRPRSPRFDLALRFAGAPLQPAARQRQPARPALRARSARRLQSPAARSPTRRCRARAARAAPGADRQRGRRSRPRSATARPTSPSSCRWPSAARRGRCRSSVQIVWDASGSGAQRQIDRELALLDAYFRRVARHASVSLVRVADVAVRADALRASAAATGRPCAAPCEATVVRRRQQPRRGAPRRRLGRSALVQRRPGQLRRAVAARLPGAGVRDQQRRRAATRRRCRRSPTRAVAAASTSRR